MFKIAWLTMIFRSQTLPFHVFPNDIILFIFGLFLAMKKTISLFLTDEKSSFQSCRSFKSDIHTLMLIENISIKMPPSVQYIFFNDLFSQMREIYTSKCRNIGLKSLNLKKTVGKMEKRIRNHVTHYYMQEDALQ